jgi:hypothetical protein
MLFVTRNAVFERQRAALNEAPGELESGLAVAVE